MAEIAALHGIRFEQSRSGPIGPLLAPPYDAAAGRAFGPEFSISAIENSDLGLPGNQHERAARTYDRWLASGVLRRDAEPALYVHRHQFQVAGQPVVRTGFMARVRLRNWADRVILPHEATVQAPRDERLGRLRAVGANLSPLYFLFRDPEGEIRSLLAGQTAGDLTAGELDRAGGRHEFVAVTDPVTRARLVDLFAERSLFVADGHHRYEAALMHRDAMRQLHPGVDGPWEYVLALLAAAEDPGVLVLPTHRVVSGGTTGRPDDTLNQLREWFDLRAHMPLGHNELPPPLFRLALAGSGQEWEARPRPGTPHQALLPETRGNAWRTLEISVVEATIQRLNGSAGRSIERYVAPVVDEHEATARVQDGLAQAAFFLPTPRVGHLMAVAEQGDLLPPKSSWFEPKAPAGLVINDHRRSAP